MDPFVAEDLVGSTLLVEPSSPGLREFGIPPGGPMDRGSAALARALALADFDSIALECMGRVRVRVNAVGRLGVAGAQVSISGVGSASVVWGASLPTAPGEDFEIVQSGVGARLYLAWSSSISPLGMQILDEPPASLAGLSLKGNRVTDFASFPRSRPEAEIRDEGPERGRGLGEGRLRVIPFADHPFAPIAVQILPLSSRMGLRCTSPLGPHTQQLTSEPASWGTVQWTPSGELILLGPDGPTLGGYPKIGAICQADLDKLGQLVAGTTIKLQPITLEEALEESHQANQRLAKRIAQIRQVLGSSGK